MPNAENRTAVSLGRFARLGLRLFSPRSLYVDWLVAETEATLALAAWRSARPGVKASAHDVYVAAVARETRAAELLACRVMASAPRPT